MPRWGPPDSRLRDLGIGSGHSSTRPSLTGGNTGHTTLRYPGPYCVTQDQKADQPSQSAIYHTCDHDGVLPHSSSHAYVMLSSCGMSDVVYVYNPEGMGGVGMIQWTRCKVCTWAGSRGPVTVPDFRPVMFFKNRRI